MDNLQFIYWLSGLLEYTEVSDLSETDLKVKLQGIKDHLELVVKKVTPKAPVIQKSLNDFEKEISDKIKKAQDDKVKRDDTRITPDKWKFPINPAHTPIFMPYTPVRDYTLDPWYLYPSDSGKPITLMC